MKTTPRIASWRTPLLAGAVAAAVIASGAFVADAAGGGHLAATGGARRLSGDPASVVAQQAAASKAKNVILLIGDGMGDSEITVARDYAYGAAGRLPGIDALPMTGDYTTYSLEKGTSKPVYVTDSAASATGFATGTKTYNGAISVNTHGRPTKTLLEIAKANGLKTGDVSTAELQDATPAVQVAHVSDRSCYGPNEVTATCASNALENGGAGSITEQLLKTRPDVTLGGGAATFRERAKAGAYAGDTLLAQAKQRGYDVVTSKKQLAAVKAAGSDTPVLGLFADGNFATNYRATVATKGGGDKRAKTCRPNRAKPGRQPGLSAMTTKAIALLENEKGFFLQVEGASIDKQDHAADACGQIGETLDFDRAVRAALRYAKKQGDTTVIVTADHGQSSQIVEETTPGLTVKLRTADKQNLIVAYGTAGTGKPQQHTGTQVRIAAYGPDSARVVGLTDQTDTFFTIVDALSLTR